MSLCHKEIGPAYPSSQDRGLLRWYALDGRYQRMSKCKTSPLENQAVQAWSAPCAGCSVDRCNLMGGRVVEGLARAVLLAVRSSVQIWPCWVTAPICRAALALKRALCEEVAQQ